MDCALDLLSQAGVELLPFDPKALNGVSADADRDAYGDTENLARYVCLKHILIAQLWVRSVLAYEDTAALARYVRVKLNTSTQLKDCMTTKTMAIWQRMLLLTEP